MHREHHSIDRPMGRDFLSGLLFGASVGAAAGLLFAPKAGAEVRDQMARSADNLRRQAGETYDRASSMMHEAVDRGKDAWRRGRDRFEETRDELARDVSSKFDEHTTM